MVSRRALLLLVQGAGRVVEEWWGRMERVVTRSENMSAGRQ